MEYILFSSLPQGKFIRINFDVTGYIVGANIETCILSLWVFLTLGKGFFETAMPLGLYKDISHLSIHYDLLPSMGCFVLIFFSTLRVCIYTLTVKTVRPPGEVSLHKTGKDRKSLSHLLLHDRWCQGQVTR